MKYIKTFEKLSLIKQLRDTPDKLYHLTPAEYIDRVKKNGLKVKFSKQHRYTEGVYLASRIHKAMEYSYADKEVEDWYIIEIPFDNLNTKYMKPDDYELFDALEDDYPELLDELGFDKAWGNDKLIWGLLDYRNSLYMCEQMLYTKDISPDKFSKIYHKSDLVRN